MVTSNFPRIPIIIRHTMGLAVFFLPWFFFTFTASRTVFTPLSVVADLFWWIFFAFQLVDGDSITSGCFGWSHSFIAFPIVISLLPIYFHNVHYQFCLTWNGTQRFSADFLWKFPLFYRGRVFFGRWWHCPGLYLVSSASRPDRLFF